MTIAWKVQIDWDNDGTYAYDEAALVTALKIDRGRTNQFTGFSVGKATLWLDNESRRFDPYYPSSALYPNVLPRRKVRILATEDSIAVSDADALAVSDAETLAVGFVYLFAGKIEDIEPSGHRGQRTVCITVYDGLRDLVGTEVALALQADVTHDEALAALLTAAGWTAGDRDLDVSSDTMAYYWALPGTNAKTESDRIALSEYGAFFVDRNGDATFVNRTNYTSGTAVGSIDEDIITDIQITAPWASVYNDIRARCYPLTLAASGDVWTLEDDDIELAAGETVTIWVEYSDANGNRCAAASVIDPAATTDYTANTQADGGGADMTASMSVTATKYDTWAKLEVENTHGATSFFITLLKIRGQAITQEAVQLRHEDATSQTTYGRRQLLLELATQQSVETANTLAAQLLTLYNEPSPNITIRLDNRISDILAYELCDIITFTSDEYSLAAPMRLEQFTLWTGVSMQDLKADLLLTPAYTTTSPWLLGTAGRTELGDTTYLGW